MAPFDVDLFRQPLKEIRELTEDDTNDGSARCHDSL